MSIGKRLFDVLQHFIHTCFGRYGIAYIEQNIGGKRWNNFFTILRKNISRYRLTFITHIVYWIFSAAAYTLPLMLHRNNAVFLDLIKYDVIPRAIPTA